MHARDIRQVIELLDTVLDDPTLAPPQLKLFPALYLQVTRSVSAGIDAGHFDDGERMDRLDTIFANRYFQALAVWRAGGRPTGPWRVAFEFAAEERGIALQHLLLGLNAHINLDLSVAVARAVPADSLEDVRADYARINEILASMVDGAQGVLNEFSPMLDILDRVGGGADEALAEFSIHKARAAAWRAAEHLVDFRSPKQQKRSIRLLEGAIKLLARSIARPGPLVAAAVAFIRLREDTDVEAMVHRLRTADLNQS